MLMEAGVDVAFMAL